MHICSTPDILGGGLPTLGASLPCHPSFAGAVTGAWSAGVRAAGSSGNSACSPADQGRLSGSPADGALLPGKAEAQSRKMPPRPSFICGLARSLINSVRTECLPHGLPTVAGTEDRASSKTTPALPPHPVSRDAQAQSCPRALRPRVGEHVGAVVACGGPR